jgi:polysaccharide biosynthesis transport protein
VSVQSFDHIIMISQPNSPVAEAYRTLRASLNRGLAQGKRFLSVTSSWPGDGKSMVCTNLAVALSQLHLGVILLDGDLRRPTVSRVFGLHTCKGLTDYLEEEVDLNDIVYPTAIPGLSVVPTGLSKQNPANLLGRERLRTAFDRFRELSDCVVADTSPMSACSDALLLGVQTDGAIMVVSPGSWDGDVEERHKQQLVEHGIQVLGVVLNGATETEHSSYGYGSGYGNYGQPQPQIAEPSSRFKRKSGN